MRYTTSLDKKAKLVTFGITTLLFIITLAQLQAQQSNVALFTAILLAVIYGLSFALSPKAYTVTANDLIIEKRLGQVVIKRSDIKSVSLLPADALNGSLRIFGVGGVFGYFGKFTNSQLGKMTWYVTRKDNAVLVTTNDDKKIILTPDEATNFAANFK